MLIETILILTLNFGSLFSDKITKDDAKTICSYGCKNYIKLCEENVVLAEIKKIKIRVNRVKVKSKLIGFVMEREKVWVTTDMDYGSKPKSMGRKKLLPDKVEAAQWVEKNECKIGRLCYPDGDCWGANTKACDSDEANTWVKNRNYHYEMMSWTVKFHWTCTMDWKCSIITKSFSIHFNSEGETFVVIDNSKLKIDDYHNDQYFVLDGFSIFFPKIPKMFEKEVEMSCFKFKEDFLCEGEEDEYVLFEQGTRCTVLGSTKYCLVKGMSTKIRDFGATEFASISDINQLRDAFIVEQEKENYNFFVIQKKLQRIQKIIISLIESLSGKNPGILNSVLKGHFFTRPLTEGVFEVCNCREVPKCHEKEQHYENIDFCPKFKVNSLELFNIGREIDFSVDEEFNFQGKDINIEESIAEEEERNSDFEEHSDLEDGGFWDKIKSVANPLSFLSSWISYIALILSIMNFFRR